MSKVMMRTMSMGASLPWRVSRQQIALRLLALLLVVCAILIASMAGIRIEQQSGHAAQVAVMSAEHIDGTIVSVTKKGGAFTLRTASGDQLLFSCGASCDASFEHIQRHIYERAHTDVYFIHKSNELQALYID